MTAVKKFDVTLNVYEKGKKVPRYTLESDKSGEMSLKDFLEYQKNVLISVALEALREEQDQGFPRKPVVVVDNKKNKNVTDVSPLGKIQFLAKASGTKMIYDTYTQIVRISKVVTGEYRSSHRVVYNGRIVASSEPEFFNWIDSKTGFDENDEVVFVNIAPYARRLETLGVTATRQQNRLVNSRSKDKNSSKPKIRVPNGVYYITYRNISRRHKYQARITFRMVDASRYGGSGKFKNQGKGKKSAGRNYLYPSIMIKFTDPGAIT